MLVHQDGIVRLVEDILVDGSGLDELLPLVGRGGHHLGLPLVDPGEVFVAFGLLEQTLERVSRGVMLLIEVENPFVVLDRSIDLSEVILANLGSAQKKSDRELRVVCV